MFNETLRESDDGQGGTCERRRSQVNLQCVHVLLPRRLNSASRRRSVLVDATIFDGSDESKEVTSNVEIKLERCIYLPHRALVEPVGEWNEFNCSAVASQVPKFSVSASCSLFDLAEV
ncbi:hypothetical protein [Maricaulis sp.]|uniref:hypothetical protein n=1 Tax=Maricaulis sp. TaxID=1486257 RepID=UPI002B267164|nr:hypothetical protein [Maricaulis sp.]